MVYYALTKEQASQIAQAVQSTYKAPAWPVDPALYVPAELLAAIKKQNLLDYTTGELRRRLVMLNERNNGIQTLADVVFELHQALVVKLNNGHKNQ